MTEPSWDSIMGRLDTLEAGIETLVKKLRFWRLIALFGIGWIAIDVIRWLWS